MFEPALKCENNERDFHVKIYSKAVYCFSNGIFLLFWNKGKSRFSRFPAKKSFITSITCPNSCFILPVTVV